MEPVGELQSPPTRRLFRAPLVPAALAMIAGLVLGRYLSLPTGLWALCALAAMLIAAATLLRSHLHLISVIAAATAILCGSAFYIRWAYFTIPPDHIVTFTGATPSLATVDGRIITSPQQVDRKDLNLPYPREDQTTFVLQAAAIHTLDGPRSASGLLRVTINEPAPRLAAGQNVRLLCSLGRFRAADNPGQADPAQFARLNQTLAWASVPGADGVTQLGQPAAWPLQAYWRLRAIPRQHLTECGDREEGHLLNALLIGERHPALRELNRAMVQAGTAHYLSISGSHLAIFLGFIYLICRLLALPPRTAAAAVLVVLTLYMTLAEPSGPLFRSAIMAASLCLATIFYRRYIAANVLAGAAILLLIVNPLDLFAAGFQLSFAIVLGMLLLTAPLRDLLFGRWLQRRGLLVFRADQRAKRWLYFRAAQWAINATAMSLAAYLVSAPLVAYHFGLFSPYAGPLSLLLALPMAVVLVPGYISMMLLWPAPNLAQAIGDLAAQAAHLLWAIVLQMQRLPALCFELRPISVPWVIAAYAAIAFVVLARRLPHWRIAAPSCIVALAAFTTINQWPTQPPAVAQLHVLAVGAGQCVVLQAPSGKTVILDAGTRSSFDACRTVLAPFLRYQKLPAPQLAFVSHANADHFNALTSLMAAKPPQTLYLNEPFGQANDDPAVADLLEAAHTRGCRIERLHAGQEIAIDDRTKVQVLWPPPQTPRPATQPAAPLAVNDTSLVLRVTCDDKSILLPGDVANIGEAALLRLPPNLLKSDVLMMPHHGSLTRNTQDFVRRVAPRIVLISSSQDPWQFAPANGPATQPAPTAGLGADLYGTWKNGYIRLRFGRGQLTAQPAHDENPN